MNSSELNTQEIDYPDEYLKKADELIKARELKEAELRKNYTPIGGRDDRLSSQIRELDLQLRHDIDELRKKYNLKSEKKSSSAISSDKFELGSFDSILNILNETA